MIAIRWVVIQVQINKVDWHSGLDTTPDGFYHRVGRFNRKVDDLISLILVEDNRDLGESSDTFFHYILKGAREFHGYRIRLDALEKVPDRAGELQAEVNDRDGMDGTERLKGVDAHGKLIGVMEKWSTGILGKKSGFLSFSITPLLQHSITPVFFCYAPYLRLSSPSTVRMAL
jgi:hypothetical protein